MEFQYSNSFKNAPLPEAYERLLLDAIQGDAALFTREDEIELSWKLIDYILHGWESPQAPPLEMLRSRQLGTGSGGYAAGE